MENLLGGLALAIVTGLAYVAYRHPKQYHRFLWLIGGTFAVVWIVLKSYNFGIRTVMQIFHSPDPAQAGQALNDMSYYSETIEWAAWGAAGLLLIAIGLSYLPKLLDLDKKDKVESK